MPLKNRASRLFLYFALAACFAGWLNELASADDEIEDAVTDAVDEDDADPEVEDKAKKVQNSAVSLDLAVIFVTTFRMSLSFTFRMKNPNQRRKNWRNSKPLLFLTVMRIRFTLQNLLTDEIRMRKGTLLFRKQSFDCCFLFTLQTEM